MKNLKVEVSKVTEPVSLQNPILNPNLMDNKARALNIMLY